MLQPHTRVSWCIDAAAVTEKPRSCRRLLSDHPVVFGRARAVVLARPTLAPRSLFPPAMASVASVVPRRSRRVAAPAPVALEVQPSDLRGVVVRAPRPPRTPPGRRLDAALSASRDRTRTAPRLRPLPGSPAARRARARVARARARVVRRRLRPPTRFPRGRRARRRRGGPRRRARPGRRGPRRLPARRAQLRVRHVRARGGSPAAPSRDPRDTTPRSPRRAPGRRCPGWCRPRGGDPDPRRVHLRPISRGTPLLVRCAWTRRAARRSPCSARSPIDRRRDVERYGRINGRRHRGARRTARGRSKGHRTRRARARRPGRRDGGGRGVGRDATRRRDSRASGFFPETVRPQAATLYVLLPFAKPPTPPWTPSHGSKMRRRRKWTRR